MTTKTIDPAHLSPGEFYKFMIGTIGPRPIAFASTIDAQGNVNLSPYSFFGMFGYNPPTLVFAPTINRHGHKKHTLLNVEEVGEVVINVVNYAMVEQMSLASAEFERGVNEFGKAGFTAVASDRIRPPRVAESPAAYECIVKQIIATGDGDTGPPERVLRPGAGHLIVCEVVMAHLHDTIFTENGVVDPHRVDLIGRLGGDWYARAHGPALFEVDRPKTGIGVDQIPAAIRNSAILTGNDLGKLGSADALPAPADISTYRASDVMEALFDEARNGCQHLPDLLHLRAKQLLSENNVRDAWLTLLSDE